MWLIADGNNLWFRIGYSARIEFFTAYAIDDMLFGISGSWFGYWADDIGLVVFPWKITFIDINNVVGVVKSKHWIISIPMNIMQLTAKNDFQINVEHNIK